MRFTYCAAVVSYLLDDWSGFNKKTAYANILASQSYEVDAENQWF